MADTTPVETVTPGDSQTPTVTTTSVPATDNASAAEVERLRKEKEQADLRIRQLENQAAARQKADDEAKAQQLEENEQFKDLWEKERAEKETLIREREDATRRAALESATNTLLKDYSPAVQELASTAGLALTDDSETSVAELKSKLDTFASKLGSPKVVANNPAPSGAPVDDRSQQVKVMRMNNVPTAVRNSATRKAVSGLESIKAMKANAGLVTE